MEEGELPGESYDPALEWPGEPSFIAEDTYDDISPTIKQPRHTVLRLLVTQTSILPHKQKLVDLEAYTELQFGRDVIPPGSETPRVRLKEMEVSKLHATVYWDKRLEVWGLVDHGSMHGTFVKPYTDKPEGASLQSRLEEDKRGVRLSAPRVASVPRTLKHLDSLSIGGTTFLIHIHEDRFTCEDCSSGVAHEIPLFSASGRTRESSKRSSETAGFSYAALTDPKKALKMLKYDLMTKQSAKAAEDNSYVDRAARRRAQHPESRTVFPGIQLPSPLHAPSNPFKPHKAFPDRPTDMFLPPVSISAPPTALSDTNMGHRLLTKQGWQPGKALGQLEDSSGGERTALLEPIRASGTIGRAGIGMSASASEPQVEKSAIYRRWDNT